MQGPSLLWALLKAGLTAKDSAIAIWKGIWGYLLPLFIVGLAITLTVVPANAQPSDNSNQASFEVPTTSDLNQHTQLDTWGTVTEEPFEHAIIWRGASSMAVPVLHLPKLGHSSIDVQFGERHTLGPDTQDYFRQFTGFANVNIRKIYKYGMVRAGYEVDVTERASGRATNFKPFAEGWFGNWSETHPGSTWVYITKEQYGEGYVGRAAYTQGYRVYNNKAKHYAFTIDASVFGAYGQHSANPWNRQIGVSIGPRFHKNIWNGEMVALAEYVSAWRPNNQQDGIFRLGVEWWFGKNMKTW